MTLLHRSGTRNEAEAALEAAGAKIRIDRSGAQSIVSVSGRIGVDSAPPLLSVLLDLIQKSSRLVIDVTRVTRLDTAGLAVLLEAVSSARDHSVSLRLTGVSGQPRKLAELTELDGIFRTYGSEVEYR